MALIEKETLLKGVWDVVLIVLSGAVCVGGAGYVVNRALSRVGVPLGAPPLAAGPVAPGGPPPVGEPAAIPTNGSPPKSR